MPQAQLSKAAALKWVGDHEWRKGQSYVQGLTGLSAQPDGVFVQLQGSAHGQEKYIVRVTLSGGTVKKAHCSCPVGDGGRCKHVAAVLARRVQSPQDFTELDDLEKQLQRLDAPALRTLVRELLEREPKLQSLLLSAPGQSAGNLHQRIGQAFALVDYDVELDWEGAGPDLRPLQPLFRELRGQLAQVTTLDGNGLLALYRAAEAVLAGCEELNDDNYDLGLSDPIALGRTTLLYLLHQPVAAPLRENILDTLQESIEQLGWNRRELEKEEQFELFADLPAEERQQIQALVRRLQDSEQAEYRRRQWADTLYALTAEDDLSLEDELALAQATGDQSAVLEVLLKHGQTVEALRTLSQSQQKSVAPQEIEALFAEYGLLPQLEEYAQQHLNTFGVRSWLYQRYRDTGRTPQAHDLARNAVLKGTGDHAFYIGRWNGQLVRDPDWLSELRHISPDWPADRAVYIRQQWKKAGMTDSLLSFLLDEGLLTEAQKLVSERSEVKPELLTRLALQLPAEDAEPLVLRAVLAYVGGRGREHYRAAAETLTQAADLIGQDEARQVARLLTAQFPRLSALRSELEQARLL